MARTQQIIKLITVLFLSSFLLACASDLEVGQRKGPSKIRTVALKDAATTYGAQYGLAMQSKLIDKVLDEQAHSLGKIYHFNRLLLPDHVLPPVLIEGRNHLSRPSRDVLHLADRYYALVKPARFVTTPPSWREYLYMGIKMPEKPHFSLLPQTMEERRIWDEALVKGFKNGTRQAMLIFKSNVDLLNRDFEGMVLYGVLLSKHMVTPPYVAGTKRDISGDRTHLDIGHKTLRIAVDSGLVTQSAVWRPAVVKDSLPKEHQNDCQLMGDASIANLKGEPLSCRRPVQQLKNKNHSDKDSISK